MGILGDDDSALIQGGVKRALSKAKNASGHRRMRDDFEQITVTSDLSSDTDDQNWSPSPPKKMKIPRRRKVTADEEEMDPATLLLHFSRQQPSGGEIKQTAIV
mmetsp:Transcript_87189/g.251826  ORF Transcript_87189/g.251826 Transcript_87189/m.251826 type:complete len:103 (+) Transcript_87189:46-354(+)|eukprot:CAMPEP_0176089430 /NCGR_PEP_ID=MMETSP0120_2-20121206/44789_1 /TAXON_ID=160619 /ORGANISM="Kryptoperidinium foliaceum, Strain CCMP 1326" /LENGTH=102 /DNA_ID=CAMNT_0017423311 /DNA_START=185 /DNA_END=493 /DNA_ORIENTATION=+